MFPYLTPNGNVIFLRYRKREAFGEPTEQACGTEDHEVMLYTELIIQVQGVENPSPSDFFAKLFYPQFILRGWTRP